MGKLAKTQQRFNQEPIPNLIRTYYFSAVAYYYQNTPLEGRIRRHESYIKALTAKGVVCQLGNFAKRDLSFKAKNYKANWRRREEKQTDVAIASNLIANAFLDIYDAAYVVSCDTDMLPAIRLVKQHFPNKRVVTVAPPSRQHHRDLLKASDDSMVIKRSQIVQSLFGAQIVDCGKVVARRPTSYTAP